MSTPAPRFFPAALAAALLFLCCSAVLAVEGAGGPRARRLIFPYADSTAGSRTFLRVTWSGDGPMSVHDIYLDAVTDPVTGFARCREFNRFRDYTEHDLEVWDVRTEAPSFTRGFVVVEAPTAPAFLQETLFGDSVVLSTTEGWILGITAIPWEPGDFVTFGNHFFPSFVNSRLGAVPTRFVILPFSILDDGLGGPEIVQPREEVDGTPNRWTWLGNWYDHDENARNLPYGRVTCWGIRTLEQIAPGAQNAWAGYGWLDLLTDPGARFYAPGGEMAIVLQVEAAQGGGFGWTFYPARRADGIALTIGPGFPWPDNGGKTTVELF